MLEQITEQQLAEHGVVSAPDKLEGDPKDNKAVFDRLITQLVAKVVNQIIEAHNGLDKDVNGRIDALAAELRNHVDVDPGNITAKNVGLLRELANKYGLTELAPTVHDALAVLHDKGVTQAAAVTAAIQAAIGTRAQIVVGSYTGTGTHGTNNPSTLTFGFRPKLVIFNRGVQHSNTSSYGIKASNGLSAFFGNGSCVLWVRNENYGEARFTTGVKVTVTDTGVEWYYEAGTINYDGTGTAAGQLNESGTVYTYVAIG